VEVANAGFGRKEESMSKYVESKADGGDTEITAQMYCSTVLYFLMFVCNFHFFLLLHLFLVVSWHTFS
jgi:hypothetical protein